MNTSLGPASSSAAFEPLTRRRRRFSPSPLPSTRFARKRLIVTRSKSAQIPAGAVERLHGLLPPSLAALTAPRKPEPLRRFPHSG
jgi:hypothetical protein